MNLTETIEALERAAEKLRSRAFKMSFEAATSGGRLPHEHDEIAADAALLSALAKALREGRELFAHDYRDPISEPLMFWRHGRDPMNTKLRPVLVIPWPAP